MTATHTATLGAVPFDDELERLRRVTRPLQPRSGLVDGVGGLIDRKRRRILDKWRLQREDTTFTGTANELVHRGVAVVLVGVAIYVLAHTILALATTSVPFAQAAISAVNGLLFAIIIMEVMRTVTTFERGGLHLQPFLVIGIVSAVREMLAVGAHLSLQAPGQEDAPVVHLALLELGVNGAVVLGLATALVLVRRFANMQEGREAESTSEAKAQ